MSCKRFMVDIEAAGKQPGGVILSIGWVRFSPGIGVWEDTAGEVRIDLQSQLDAGLVVDGPTLNFWLTKTALPWAEGLEPIFPERALQEFSDAVCHADEVWAKPPSYDLTGLRAAHTVFAVLPRWHHRTERCFRTLKGLPTSDGLHMAPLTDGTKHGALVDAIHQAKEAALMLQVLGERE